MTSPSLRCTLGIASGWEPAIKHGLGKIGLAVPLVELLVAAPTRAMAEWLTIRADHLLRVAGLPHHHRDPFDRMIVAKALVEGLPVVSADPALDA